MQLYSHFSGDAELTLMTDASDQSVGCVLNQIVNGEPQPLGFYSKKLSNAQLNYSTFDRELTAMFLGVKHFRYMIEGRKFHIITDHMALAQTFDGNINLDLTPIEKRYLNYISQFTTDLRHISGKKNVTADFLSRINEISSTVDYEKIAKMQQNDDELQRLINENSNSKLIFKQLLIPGTTCPIYCDISTKNVRPLIPKQFRNEILTKIHGISHPGARGTTKLMNKRFVWSGINKNSAEFAKTCLHCQRSKVNRHNSTIINISITR